MLMHTETSGGGALKTKQRALVSSESHTEGFGDTRGHLKFKKYYKLAPFLFVSIQKHRPSIILVPVSVSYMEFNLDSSFKKIINRSVRLLTGLAMERHTTNLELTTSQARGLTYLHRTTRIIRRDWRLPAPDYIG